MSYLTKFLPPSYNEDAPIANPVRKDGKEVGIILDNGHGLRQYTAGKHSPDKTLFEGEWVREVVARLAPELRAIGFDARILVPEDADTPLRERCARANAIAKANPKKKWYFISVHINAAGGDGKWHDATGHSVWVANACSTESKQLARSIYGAAEKLNLKGNRSVPAEKYWTANFAVLTGTNMPAVLTENLFQDNKEEVAYLLSEKGKNAVISLHVAGICQYFGVPYSLCLAK